LNVIGKKWSINIIRDMITGKKRFVEFLSSNKGLSTRMLALRLKELEKNGLIIRMVKNEKPLDVEYQLTEIGMSLNKIIYELSIFSLSHYPNNIFQNSTYDITSAKIEAESRFKIPK
jgi:DNA-binding HxlR family transcriptional regulator